MSADRFYIADERDHEGGYYRVIDRDRESAPDYAGEEFYNLEHVVAYCPELADARAVREALIAIEGPQ